MLRHRQTHGEALCARRPQPQLTASPPPSPADPPRAQRLQGLSGSGAIHPDPDPNPLPHTAPFSMYSVPSILAVEISDLGPLSALSFARTAPAQTSLTHALPNPSCPPHTPASAQGGPALGLKWPCLDSISLCISHPLRCLCLHAALVHASPLTLWEKSTKGHTFLIPGRSWSRSHPLSPVPAPW